MVEHALAHRTLPARNGEAPHPGLLLLHGRGTDEDDLLPLAQQLDPRLFTVSARAPFPFPWGGNAWYGLDPRGVGFPDQQTLDGSLERLDRFLDEIVREYPIDPSRLYAGGFSMGAAMSATLALLYAERVAGAATLSGYLPTQNSLPFRPESAAGHPIFEAHGTLDDVIPVSWGRATRDALVRMPVDLTYREYPMGHEISGEELRDLQTWITGVLDGRETATQTSSA